MSYVRTRADWGKRGLAVLELNTPCEDGRPPTAKMIADAMIARGYVDYTPAKVRAMLQNMRRTGFTVPYLRAGNGR